MRAVAAITRAHDLDALGGDAAAAAEVHQRPQQPDEQDEAADAAEHDADDDAGRGAGIEARVRCGDGYGGVLSFYC